MTHDRGWTNDDDPGSAAPGWLRTVNLGTGDYNKDLTTSSTKGAVWTSAFTGSGVSVYAPKSSGYGTIDIQIDGQTGATASLSTTGARQAQQLVAKVTGLTAGAHTISIINRGPGLVAVDAIVAEWRRRKKLAARSNAFGDERNEVVPGGIPSFPRSSAVRAPRGPGGATLR